MQQSINNSRIAEMAAFVAVAERGSFTRAATQVGKDATVLSRRIRSLEKRLGLRLMERTTRRVSLTEAGATFLARAREILRAMDQAEQEVAALANSEPAGVLRVALPGTFGRMWIAPLLPRFILKYPRVRIEAEYSNRFTDLVAEGFDVALRLGELTDSSLVARRIATRKRILCASPAYLKRRKSIPHPRDLNPEECLGFRGFVSYPNWNLTHASGERASIRVAGPLISDDAETLIHAATQGLGVMMATDWLVGRQLKDKSLIAILQDWVAEDAGAIYLVTPSAQMLPPKTRSFIGWMTAQLSPTPPWAH